MKEIILVDNFDSFTYNLYQYVRTARSDFLQVSVVRNNALEPTELSTRPIAGIIVSPGPGRPEDAGISLPCIEHALKQNIPLLGVCLGHQALALSQGANIIRAPRPLHGYTSNITHKGSGLFKDVPEHFDAMRYHSLVVDAKTLPTCVEVTAHSSPDNCIMGLKVKNKPAWGVQFHPESFLTDSGYKIVENFLMEVQSANRLSDKAA